MCGAWRRRVVSGPRLAVVSLALGSDDVLSVYARAMIHERGAIQIHYDLEGDESGFPVLLIAPGGMKSANALWEGRPWNPRAALAARYRLIGMDQRNAGRSVAPIVEGDGWHTMLEDQLALLDHLGVERCHYVGMCIGGSYGLGLLKAAPERFASAVLLQPIGVNGDNRAKFQGMFDGWATAQDASPEALRGLRASLWDGEGWQTASAEEVGAMQTPMLVLKGDDAFHPGWASTQITHNAPNARLVERWKDADRAAEVSATIEAFLAEHTPA